MPAVVALVGRPNVGKSTLFNKLTKTRDALVADLPGLTRDRQYGDGALGEFPYIVIDTGGLAESLDKVVDRSAQQNSKKSGQAVHQSDSLSLDSEMLSQTALAIEESDVVLFLVDGRAGCTAADEEIANELRRRDIDVILVVNKIDGVGEDQARSEFYALGLGEPAAISATHSRGLLSLLNDVAERLPEELRVGENTTDEPSGQASNDDESGLDADSAPASIKKRSGPIEIAFVGRPNVGKSTLVNRLCGEERVIAYDQPGTTRDSIHIPFERAGKKYSLIDTAGVRKRGRVNETVEKFSIIKTLQAIDQANVCVFLMDANDSITDQDLHLLGYIIDKGRALVVAINKWDSVSAEERDDIRDDLHRRVEFLKFTKMHFISALHGSGVNDLFKSINRAYASAFIDLATPKLTRLLEVAVEQHQPPMVNGRRIKLRFAHQGGVNPPIVVIHGNQTNKLPGAYQRFLTNFFQKNLRLFGTPLRILYKQGENPYAKRGGAGKSHRKGKTGGRSTARAEAIARRSGKKETGR